MEEEEAGNCVEIGFFAEIQGVYRLGGAMEDFRMGRLPNDECPKRCRLPRVRN